MGEHARKDVAQCPLYGPAAFPPRGDLGGAAREHLDYFVCGAASTRTAGRAAEPALSLSKGP